MGDENEGGNPVWNEALQGIPEEFHSSLTSHFQQWDKDVEDRVSKVYSEYESWKPLIKAGIEPETANFGLNLLSTLETNPQMVYEAIGKYYGLTPAEAKAAVEESKVDDPLQPVNSKLADLERQNHIMAQHLLTRHEQETQQKAEARVDRELDEELTDLKDKYGEYNERFVLAMMDTGMSGDDAVKAYFEWHNNEVGKYVPKPLFMGSGGGLPNQNVDPRKMTEAQTKETVVEMLRSAAYQNR